MKGSFPPRPDHRDEVDKVAAVFAALVDGPSAFYVSSPITTGKRFVEWRSSPSSPDSSSAAYAAVLAREVVEPNRHDAKAFIARLRKDCAEVVVDPTGLSDLPGWTQADYRSLWAEVIERFVALLIMRDGWEFSDGCAYEFFVATRNGIRVAHEDLSSMSKEEGVRLMRSAVDRKVALGVSPEFALSVLAALREAAADPKAAPS